MSDTTVKKIDSKYSPTGGLGQKYLASGINVSMRLFEAEPANEDKGESQRDYETVGYVISGKAELHCEGQMVLLEPGHSWVVAKGAKHSYKILEPFTAVEATAPPAEVHGRDDRDQETAHKGNGKQESKNNQEKSNDGADAQACETEQCDASKGSGNQNSKESTQDKLEDTQKLELEEQATQNQEVLAKLPRNSELTSNSPQKEPQPAEQLELQSQEPQNPEAKQ